MGEVLKLPRARVGMRNSRIRYPRPAGYVDGGHVDMSAYTKNTEVSLIEPNKLGTNHVVIGTGDLQPVQLDVSSMIGRVKFMMGAAFIAPIDTEKRDFAKPTPDQFLQEHEVHDQIYKDIIDSHPLLHQVSTVEDLWFDVLHRSENVGIMKSVEGLYVNKKNYREVIDELKRRGIVSVGIMWNFDSEIGHTSNKNVRIANPMDGGLTKLGQKVVRYLDEKDIIIDLSHASDRTVEDVLAIESKNPRIFTHSGSREVEDHPRNVTDTVARRIIESGGVIGIPFVDTFIGPKGGSSVDRVAEHIEHFKNIGLLHGIMLGSDFNGMANTSVINGLHDVTVVKRKLGRALRQRGFTQTEIDKVFYGNATDFWLKHLPSEIPQGPKPEEVVLFDNSLIAAA